MLQTDNKRHHDIIGYLTLALASAIALPVIILMLVTGAHWVALGAIGVITAFVGVLVADRIIGG